MTDTPFLRDKITSLFRSPPGDTRLGDEPPGTIADAVLAVVAPLLAESQAQTANALRWLDQERELAKRASESEQVQHAEEIGQLRRAGVPADASLAAALGYGLAEDDIDLLQWLHAEKVWELTEAREHHEVWWQIEQATVRNLLEERDAAEASRRDWAAEAEKMTFVVQQRHRDLARAINQSPAKEWNELLNEGTRLAERWLDEIAAEVLAVPVDLGAWICACVTEQQAADLVATGWSLPQCTVHPPEVPDCEVPDWSALRDACDEYSTAYMGEDDSLLPAALDKVRAALRGEDPYQPTEARHG